MQIYGDRISGNCLKVKWTADALGLRHEWVDIDIMKGESRTADFLAMSPAGQVPVVRFDDGRALSQSNAIIRYLARDSKLLPTDAFAQAKVDEWLFWEQYSHEPYIAVARFQVAYLGRAVESLEERIVTRGERALDFMESSLQDRAYFVGETLTVADIALLAYTRVAHEGGFDLSGRGAVRRWIGACERDLGISS